MGAGLRENVAAAEPGADRLRIYIATEAMPAEVIGRMLTALAGDYRLCSRRSKLVLLKSETGPPNITIAATVTAAAEGEARCSDLCNFTRNILEIVVSAQRGESPRFAEGPRPPVRSARAILDAAIASKNPVRLEYLSPEGEVLKLELDPLKAAASMATLTEAAAVKRAQAHHPAKRTPENPDDGELSSLLELFKPHRTQSSPASSAADHDKALAAAIVDALDATGEGEAAEVIAERLQASGLDDLARMVRDGGTKVATLLTLEEAFARHKR
jgi:hypothetical protein